MTLDENSRRNGEAKAIKLVRKSETNATRAQKKQLRLTQREERKNAEIDRYSGLPKAHWRAIKDRKRKTFLSLMPQNGIAVEIGVWKGDFSAELLEVIQPDCLFLIDPWQNFGEPGSDGIHSRVDDGKMEKLYLSVCEKYRKEIDEGRVQIIRDFSSKALLEFPDDSISFAYVDGDHSYEGVTKDSDLLLQKLCVGGVMAFDDYHRRGWWGDGVLRAIHDFLGRHPGEVRVRSVIGAQFGIEKIGPFVPAFEKSRNDGA